MNIRAALIAVLTTGVLAAGDLIVAAASDLAPLEASLKKAYGEGVRFSFGSSGSLLQQIQNGAPFDVFLSANERYIADGMAAGALMGPARPYATGRVALYSKSGTVRTLEQLRDPKILHIAIANPAYAPYGAAAKRALESAGLWEVLKPKLVFGENVRQTLQYAESGNVEAAIVSWSLVHDVGGVQIAGATVEQAGAVVKSTHNADGARRFLDWIATGGGQAVLKSHGLFPPALSR